MQVAITGAAVVSARLIDRPRVVQAREAAKRAAPNHLHREDFRLKEVGDEDFKFWWLRAYELRGRCNARRVRRIAAADRCAGRDAAERGDCFCCDGASLHLSP